MSTFEGGQANHQKGSLKAKEARRFEVWIHYRAHQHTRCSHRLLFPGRQCCETLFGISLCQSLCNVLSYCMEIREPPFHYPVN